MRFTSGVSCCYLCLFLPFLAFSLAHASAAAAHTTANTTATTTECQVDVDGTCQAEPPASTKSHSQDPSSIVCGVYMAPSTLGSDTNMGIYTAVDLKEDDVINFPEIAIPLLFREWGEHKPGPIKSVVIPFLVVDWNGVGHAVVFVVGWLVDVVAFFFSSRVIFLTPIHFSFYLSRDRLRRWDSLGSVHLGRFGHGYRNVRRTGSRKVSRRLCPWCWLYGKQH
jgi:hypothetical protein